jgi:hypothetical protein
MSTGFLLAVEDSLSEAVGKSLLQQLGLSVSQTLGLQGNGYLKTKVGALNQVARRLPVLLLTDLDVPNRCPAQLVTQWLPHARSSGLVFRVAVVEVEAWLIADRESLAEFLEISSKRIPRDPDSVAYPKETLVELARASKNRRLREGLAPARNSTAKVGPAYNMQLCSYVNTFWDAKRASTESDSLRRAINALDRFCS